MLWFTLKEQVLQGLENRAIRKIFEPEKGEAIDQFRIFRNEKICDLCRPSRIVRRLGWACS
jgi:hypothetical protein